MGLRLATIFTKLALMPRGQNGTNTEVVWKTLMPGIREQTSMDLARPLLCVGFTWLLVATSLARGDDSGPRSLDLYFIDVMGGAATLIVTPEKESMLIDSGWPGFADRDPRRIVEVLKNQAGCNHLDHLVTTHWHLDHFGGVGGLAKAVEIKHFWDRGLPEDNDTGLDFPDGPKTNDPLGIAYRAASQGKRTALKPGDSIVFRGELKSLVVASGGKVIHDSGLTGPNPECRDVAGQSVDPSDNARSLAIRFRFGAVRLPRLRRPHLEHRASARVPAEHPGRHRPVSGDPSWYG